MDMTAKEIAAACASFFAQDVGCLPARLWTVIFVLVSAILQLDPRRDGTSLFAATALNNGGTRDEAEGSSGSWSCRNLASMHGHNRSTGETGSQERQRLTTTYPASPVFVLIVLFFRQPSSFAQFPL